MGVLLDAWERIQTASEETENSLGSLNPFSLGFYLYREKSDNPRPPVAAIDAFIRSISLVAPSPFTILTAAAAGFLRRRHTTGDTVRKEETCSSKYCVAFINNAEKLI